MTKSHTVFAYGTLRSPKVLQKVLHRVPLMHSDRLEGFKRKRMQINGRRYYVVDPEVSAFTEGLILLGISQPELNILDTYETSAYQRKRLTLASGTIAWVYCRSLNK